jgi:tetratricopeptide (TPR) repeat protein
MKASPGLMVPVVLASTLVTLLAQAPQGGGGPGGELIRQGSQLDIEGKGVEARTIFQKAIDSAPTPAAKANAQRAVAMSWAFEGNCQKTAEYENMTIAYWKTQEKSAPANAFYQEGEMADEAARVCIDNGELTAAEELYRKGHDLGVAEPDIPAGRKDLWDFRWQHAQARIAARRGNKAEAGKHAAAAKAILDDLMRKDPKLYAQQAGFLPYLTGYVALYTGDYNTALDNLQQANANDAFIQCLIGMTYEKLGDKTKAMEAYRKAAEARGHNPPAAFGRPFARKKLGQD